MNQSDAIKFQALFEKGDLTTLAKGLEPFLKDGDLDARYLACGFSIDPNETGEAFDLRRLQELKALASEWHRASLVDLAWAYRHGDDVERDEQKFQNLMTAAALLGDQGAIRVLAELLEFELGENGLGQVLDQQNG
jgi:TPR repeat protein